MTRSVPFSGAIKVAPSTTIESASQTALIVDNHTPLYNVNGYNSFLSIHYLCLFAFLFKPWNIASDLIGMPALCIASKLKKFRCVFLSTWSSNLEICWCCGLVTKLDIINRWILSSSSTMLHLFRLRVVIFVNYNDGCLLFLSELSSDPERENRLLVNKILTIQMATTDTVWYHVYWSYVRNATMTGGSLCDCYQLCFRNFVFAEHSFHRARM